MKIYRVWTMTMVAVAFGAAVANRVEGRFRIDINRDDQILTRTGWTALNTPATGSGGTVTIDGIVFEVIGADGARLRATGGPNPNALSRDFAFDDGVGQDVGIKLGAAGDLAAGTWEADVYAWDAGGTVGNLIVGYRSNGVEHVITSIAQVSAGGPASTFQFESDGAAAYEIFVRENNSQNRSRFNGIELRLCDYRIDINNANDPVTNAGWVALDANYTGTGGSASLGSVAFAPSSADGARTRGGSNALLRDFIFDDGAGQAVGLLFGGAADLEAGVWEVDMYAWDASFPSLGNMFALYRRNSAETIVSSTVTASSSGPAITFKFVNDGIAAYDVFFRENSGVNRTRLNAVALRYRDDLSLFARYDMDDGAGDVSAGSGSTTVAESADEAAAYLTASDMSALTTWGMDVPPTANAQISVNSQDTSTWWSRGSLLPAAVDTGANPYTAFTLAPNPNFALSFTNGIMVLHIGVNDRNQAGNYNFTVHVYEDLGGGGVSQVGSATSPTVDQTLNDPWYQDIAVDLSSLGVTTEAVTLRMYFTDGSTSASMHPVLDTVSVYGEEIATAGTMFLIR